MYPDREMTTAPQPPVESIKAPEMALIGGGVPANVRARVLIDVIHDGHWIPQEFLTDKHGKRLDLEDLQADFVRERDWGAGLIASRIASRIGLRSFERINVARVLMDFGRFPGSTPPHADHLNRFAINYPFSEFLSYTQKKNLLESYYDIVSAFLESRLEDKLVKIAIHTYDQFNKSGTERPATSLMTRSIGYQTASELPWGLFDPLYPDVLAEFTSDRILRDRISLTLEKALVPVAHNYPYCLPEGSLEVRYQVWSYFQALRESFEITSPHTKNDRHFAIVWEMLQDTNLRSSHSETLRSYLHMYRRAPAGAEALFQKAAVAYRQVVMFCEERGERFTDLYRFSPERTSSIAIEVRKDIICNLDENGLPASVKWDCVNQIADRIAEAIVVYFREDRDVSEEALPDFDRNGPWYDNGKTRL